VVAFGVEAELEAGAETAALGVDAALELVLEFEPVAVEPVADSLAAGAGVFRVSEPAEVVPAVGVLAAVEPALEPALDPEPEPAAFVETGAAENPLLTSAAKPA
jgi:hypothetical protein